MEETKWKFTKSGLWSVGNDNWKTDSGEAERIQPEATLGGSLLKQIEKRDGGMFSQWWLERNTGHSHLFQSFVIVFIPFYVLLSNAAFEKKTRSHLAVLSGKGKNCVCTHICPCGLDTSGSEEHWCSWAEALEQKVRCQRERTLGAGE